MNTPTSKIRSAHQGFVELKGNLKISRPIKSPLSHVPCAWWKITIKEKRYEGGRKSIIIIKQGESESSFIIYDNTGEALIHPEGADIIPHITKKWSGNSVNPALLGSIGIPKGSLSLFSNKYEYEESLLLLDKPLYAIGMFHTFYPRDTLNDPGSIVREWKKDYQKLIAKFDTNVDGKLDMDEWQKVLAAAEQEWQEKHHHMELNQEEFPPVNILSMDGMPKSKVFMLSGKRETELIKLKSLTMKSCVIGISILLIHNIYELFTLSNF